jgi:CRISPR-associated protein Cmr1
MPKTIPVCPEAPSQRESARGRREYPIALITPLFGGGVEAGEPDSSFPIRGTSIRGHLQFWWRATRGADFPSRDDLFRRHGEIWGTTEKASPVQVEIRDVKASAPKSCARYEWNQQARQGQGGWRLNWEAPFRNTALPYALFPFQGQPPPRPVRDARPDELPAHFIESGGFTLHMRFPETLRQEVEAAVWAWVNFGGLGARTRRGCGALFCRELAAKDFSDLERWFRTGTGITASDQREWPTVPSRFLSHHGAATPIEIWDRIIGFLRHFRQGEEFARNRGQNANRPGRSRYPEPETIRRVTKRRMGIHARLAHIPDDAFPRAELGLPIVFHYQGQGQGDPPDTVLYPANGPDGKPRERMASPLILKPLALANGQAVPLIMRLVAPRLTGVDLRQGQTSLPLPSTTVVQDARLAAYSDSPLAGTTSGSALDAFFAIALDAENGFQEVTK